MVMIGLQIVSIAFAWWLIYKLHMHTLYGLITFLKIKHYFICLFFVLFCKCLIQRWTSGRYAARPVVVFGEEAYRHIDAGAFDDVVVVLMEVLQPVTTVTSIALVFCISFLSYTPTLWCTVGLRQSWKRRDNAAVISVIAYWCRNEIGRMRWWTRMSCHCSTGGRDNTPATIRYWLDWTVQKRESVSFYY